MNEAGKSRLSSEHANAFLYEHGSKKVVFLLSTTQFAKVHEIYVDDEVLKVTMPSKGCAIVTIEEDSIHSSLVKGINDYDQSFIIPKVAYKDDIVECDETADLFYSAVKERGY